MTAPRLEPGQVIAGKYTVRSLLGFGGATATYNAANAAGQAVAVKTWTPAFGSRQDLLTALQQAIGVTNALSPDSVLPVIDFGIDPALSAPFTVTDLCPFPVVRGPLPIGDVIALLRGMAKALDPAHAKGLAHGALKPTNVFFGPVPQRAVKVADFAVRAARVVTPSQEGFASAAPWMAPEQLTETADAPAVDVFSAALVAFFAATGRSYWRACQGPVPDSQAWQQELAAPRTGASVRAREVGATLPPNLDIVMSRALSANPSERFATVGELAEAFASRGSAAKLGMTMPLQASPFAAIAAAAPAPPAPEPPPPPAPPPMPSADLGSTLAIPSQADMIPPGLSGLPDLGGTQPEGEPETVVTRSPLNDFVVAPGFAGPPQPQAFGGYPQPQAQAPTQPQPQQPQAQMQGYGPGAQAQPYPPTPAYAPAEPPGAGQPKKKMGLLIGVIVGAIVFLGIIGAVVAFFVTRGGSEGPSPKPVASATAPATTLASTAAAATAVAPEPPATQEAPQADTAAPAAAATEDAGAAADDSPAEITVTCNPTCESLTVDGNAMQDLVDPVQLPAGTHSITVGKPGYVSQTRKITPKAGDKQTVTFNLFKPGPAVVAPPREPPRPCAKFVKHCP